MFLQNHAMRDLTWIRVKAVKPAQKTRIVSLGTLQQSALRVQPERKWHLD